MPLLIVALALDTDQPERSTMLNSAVADVGDALAIARALGEVQSQILGQIVPKPTSTDGQAPPSDGQAPPAPEGDVAPAA